MADFRGFLERRKRERNMQRNTMESQINGLVNSLHTDLDKMMMANEKRKVMQLMSARSSFKLTESKINSSKNATTKRNQPDFKAEADKRENQLLKEAADDLTSLGDESAIVSTANKQPPPLRLSITHRAPATNIFN